MARWEAIKKFIKHPGRWLWAFWSALFVCVAAAILLAVFFNGANALSYSLYALILALTIYCVCVSVRPAKAAILKLLRSNRVTARFLKDYGYRAVIFSAFSLAVNFIYAVAMAVLGLALRSPWYGYFAGYYIVLTAMRAAVICGAQAIKRRSSCCFRAMQKLYLACGCMIVVLSTAFATLAGYLVFSGTPARGGIYGAILLACYAFYKIISSAVHFARVRKFRDFLLQALSNINLADALVSVYALQISMVATFSQGADAAQQMFPLNIAMGAAVFLSVFCLGVYMAVRSAVGLKRAPLPEEEVSREVGSYAENMLPPDTQSEECADTDSARRKNAVVTTNGESAEGCEECADIKGDLTND